MTNNKILIVIPARKGSSFHRKNIQLVNNLPLISYTLEASKISIPHETLVSTDDPYVAELVYRHGFQIDERPNNLCDDLSTLDQVMFYVATTYTDYDIYICLPPTSPCRNKEHVQSALDMYLKFPKADSLVSVTEERKAVWQQDEDSFLKPLVERTLNRQHEKPCFISNGAIFISNRDQIIKTRRKVSGRTIPYIMDAKSSVDVHDESDLRQAEYWLK